MKAFNSIAKNKKSWVQETAVKISQKSDSEDQTDLDEEKSSSFNEEIENEGNLNTDDENENSNEEVENGENIITDDEASSGAEGDDESNEVKDNINGNPHWADAMKKILNTKKPKRKKSIVLSKAKKLIDIVPKPKEIILPFELESKDGEIKTETIKIDENVTKQNNSKQKEQRTKNGKKNIRVKPSILDKDYEKRLQRIATNGVVQLFNAVKQQQKEIQNKLVEAGPLERKREKALKSINKKSFLNVLMGGTNKLSESNKEEQNNINKEENEVWSVLRDDFVMGAKLKDWNKQTSDEESSAPEEMDSD